MTHSNTGNQMSLKILKACLFVCVAILLGSIITAYLMISSGYSGPFAFVPILGIACPAGIGAFFKIRIWERQWELQS